MGENLIIGCVTMTVCLAAQCVLVSLLLRLLFHLDRKQIIRPTLVATSTLLGAAMLVMLVGNLLQMVIWAGLFLGCGEFADYDTAFYHSVVNFSTLGYGDLVMSDQRRLLGALEAANGVLMFGLTTSFLFAVLGELMHRAWETRVGEHGKSRV